VLAKAGFVVIASDYRFHGPTAKRDEWGAADRHDQRNRVDFTLNSEPHVRDGIE